MTITVDEVYDETNQMKRFPSTNASCVELCKFVSKLSIAINTFNVAFKKYANNMVYSNGAGRDKEESLKLKASERLDELRKIYIDYTKELNTDEKLIAQQIYRDLIATKIREYSTISMHSTDGKLLIAGYIKPEVSKTVANMQNQMHEARKQNPNSWFVNELYDYLFNSSNIDGHTKSSLEQLRSKQHTLETQVKNNFRHSLDENYVINDVKHEFANDDIALKFFDSRRDYYSKISGNLQIYGGIAILTSTQKEIDSKIDDRKIIKLKDQSYSTFIASQAYSSQRAYRINEEIKIQRLNDLSQNL